MWTLLLVGCAVAQFNSTPPLPPGLQLAFSDNFEGSGLDRSKWSVDVDCWGGGNLEQQCYVDHPDVIRVGDGVLHLDPQFVESGYQLTSSDACNSDKPGACTGRLPIRSGRIHSLPSRGFGYGRFEMRAQLPRGNYLWPTFWLLPTEERFGPWPASGEVDIMEVKGSDPEEVGFTLHHGGPYPHNLYFAQTFRVPGLGSDYHTFGVDWDSEGFRFFVDATYIHHVATKNHNWNNPNQPPPQSYSSPGQPWTEARFYMVLNLAVAGNFFGPGWKFDPQRDASTWNQPFLVDYIKVYQ
ncbi:hypothetical protein DSO57_1000014 [Entomophthora muscae]|uniref:Uncharacterized protein n=1 Tax=Entomophthora muscae TaxID=34485 RepID=A0ACC2SM17_9FUNG|nr:hypothetical protein DSO57_1000014 [Entomophthora muscae]